MSRYCCSSGCSGHANIHILQKQGTAYGPADTGEFTIFFWYFRPKSIEYRVHRSKRSKRKFNNTLVREAMTKQAENMDKDLYVCCGAIHSILGKDYFFCALFPIQMELNTFISKNECECMNESDDHPMQHCLTSGGGYLQSDCDEQLILSITFNQAVKIHSIMFKAPPKLGPKNLKIFINQPRTVDFDMAESFTSVQDLV